MSGGDGENFVLIHLRGVGEGYYSFELQIKTEASFTHIHIAMHFNF